MVVVSELAVFPPLQPMRAMEGQSVGHAGHCDGWALGGPEFVRRCVCVRLLAMLLLSVREWDFSKC